MGHSRKDGKIKIKELDNQGQLLLMLDCPGQVEKNWRETSQVGIMRL